MHSREYQVDGVSWTVHYDGGFPEKGDVIVNLPQEWNTPNVLGMNGLVFEGRGADDYVVQVKLPAVLFREVSRQATLDEVISAIEQME